MPKNFNFKELEKNVALIAVSRPWSMKRDDGTIAEGVTEDLYIQCRDWQGNLVYFRVDPHCPKDEGPKYRAYLRKQLVDVAHLNPNHVEVK